MLPPFTYADSKGGREESRRETGRGPRVIAVEVPTRDKIYYRNPSPLLVLEPDREPEFPRNIHFPFLGFSWTLTVLQDWLCESGGLLRLHCLHYTVGRESAPSPDVRVPIPQA